MSEPTHVQHGLASINLFRRGTRWVWPPPRIVMSSEVLLLPTRVSQRKSNETLNLSPSTNSDQSQYLLSCCTTLADLAWNQTRAQSGN